MRSSEFSSQHLPNFQMDPTTAVDVMGARQSNIRMAQCFARGEDPKFLADECSKFFPQCVNRIRGIDALLAEPIIQPHERAVASVVMPLGTRPRLHGRFDDE